MRSSWTRRAPGLYRGRLRRFDTNQCDAPKMNPGRGGGVAKRGAAALSLFVLVIGLASTALAGPTPRFDSWLDKHVPELLSQYRVPGAAISLIEDGRVKWTKGYGFADIEKREPVTDRTVFQVASISKSVTAWGVMELVEDGRVDLD